MRRLAIALVVAVCVLAAPAPARAIVGGEEAELGDWPWQVALLDGGVFVCGGSLVALDRVLTADHCVDELSAGDLTVVAGIVELRDGDAQRRNVADIVEHDTADLALLELREPFEADDRVAPVAVPDAATAAALTADGASTFVTGFGGTTEDGPPSDELLEVEVDVIDDDRCADWYDEAGFDVSPAIELCAGDEERGHADACFGDSGGPLVAPAPDDPSAFFLVGVVNWGDGCGRPERPTVYAEVAAFNDWLGEHGALGSDGEAFEGGPLRLPVVGSQGKASRYPATVDVTGFEGDVGGVAVELHGLDHERPADLDLWLVTPDGTTVTLLSDVGGRDPAVDVDVHIEAGGPEAADAPLPLRAAPTDLQADRQHKGARPSASLADLTGFDPNGEWQLLAADDTVGASGTLDSWTLILQP